MTEAQLAKIALDLVNRAPCEGREAETVVLVKQWLRKKTLPPPFDTPVPQVADTNAK